MVLVALVLAGSAWGLVRSPWATVRSIEVSGTSRVDAAQVRALAATELGHPLMAARVGDIAVRVRAVPLVKSVRVSRHWPSTLRITVVERTAVAALPQRAGATGVRLVDPDGVTVSAATVAPRGMPMFQVDLERSGVETLRTCLAVQQQLPKELASRVRQFGASSPDGVWLRLAGGAKVEWGSANRSALKARVLLALLKQPARTYDIRSPDRPALEGS